MVEAWNSAAWYAREDTIRSGEYFVCVRPQTREPFFLARIERYEAVPESGDNRWALFFKEYALVNRTILEVTESSKNPFRTVDLEAALKVPLGALEWKKVGERKREWSFSDSPDESDNPRAGLTIPEAKRQLADTLGIQPNQIEITIRS
jgi:hypothetical protein